MAKCNRCGRSLGFGIKECPDCGPIAELSTKERWQRSATASSSQGLRAEGVNGQLELTDRTLRIRRDGVLAFLGHGLKGDKEILLEHITSIQFKEPGGLINGYIQFAFMGGTEAQQGAFQAALDENTVVFNADQAPAFRAFRRRLEERMAEARARPDTASRSRDPLDDIERLASMRDRGLLTEEEFQRQKRKLLDA